MQRAEEPRSFKPRDVIDPEAPGEVSYWTRCFDCTPEELWDAVRRVGNRAAAVATVFGVPLRP